MLKCANGDTMLMNAVVLFNKEHGKIKNEMLSSKQKDKSYPTTQGLLTCEGGFSTQGKSPELVVEKEISTVLHVGRQIRR